MDLPIALKMANSPIPDQSEEFKRSGKRLITDPASDALLRKAKKAKGDPRKS